MLVRLDWVDKIKQGNASGIKPAFYAPPTKMACPTVAVKEMPLLTVTMQPVMIKEPPWTCVYALRGVLCVRQ